MRMRARVRVSAAMALAGAIGVMLACGGSSMSTTTTPSPTSATTITISNNAASPQNITIARGQQVTIINNDSRAHEMTSDPHPEHTDCPELNQIGHLEPGQQRVSGNFTTARTCGFHDHIAAQTAALKGSIIIR